MLVNGASGHSIAIRDRGLLYGDGVFRTFRVVQGKAQHWPLHYQKLLNDCAALGITCPARAALDAELAELIARHPDGIFKLIITRGEGVRGYAPPTQAHPSRLWDVAPLPTYPPDWATGGVTLHLCDMRLAQQPRLAGIKHLNRLENVLAAAEWRAPEIAEGLLRDTADNVIEGTRSNLFMVRKGALITPDLSQCGVAGVQRERVMAWAAAQGVACHVASFGLAALFEADEIFLVNSVIGLWPVRELQQHRWTHYPMAERIRESLSHAPD
jgi:4-amino-4-deoxychorismate lyase